MSDAHGPVGYVACRGCPDQWVTKEFAQFSGGLCGACLQREGAPRRARTEIVSRGQRIIVPKSPSRQRKHRKKPKDKRAEKAKAQARKRLAAMFPDYYDMLVADERAKVGLPPFPDGYEARRRHDDPSGEQTDAFLALYHRLDEIGVDLR